MLAQETVNNDTAGVSIANSPDGLSAIHHSQCAAVIWKRRPLPDFQMWINSLDPSSLPRARIVFPTETAGETVAQVFETCGIPNCDERQKLMDDAVNLVAIFNKIIPSPFFQLRLDVINTNACCKFHIDAVMARLVCTYRGTGTQYGISADGVEPEHVFTVPTGAPILLQGTLWPGVAQSGLLHRSPPIEGTGETRLVLVLDPVNKDEGTVHYELMH